MSSGFIMKQSSGIILPSKMHRESFARAERQKEHKAISEIILRPINYNSPGMDIDNLDLDDIVAIEFSDSGSSGVMFIETKRGIVVLKLRTDIQVDMFLSRLQELLGIPTPKMRVVEYEEEEMHRIIHQLLLASQNDEVLRYRLGGKLKTAYIEIMEYIPRQQILFTEENLHTLGRIYAFDAFVNNGDRYPLSIFRGVGNIQNIIFAKEGIYAIDSIMMLKAINPHVQDNIIAKYLESLSNFLQALKSDITQGTNQSFDKLGQFILDMTGQAIDNQQFIYVQRGFLEQMRTIANIGMQSIDAALKERLLDRIHLDFHQNIVDLYLLNL